MGPPDVSENKTSVSVTPILFIADSPSCIVSTVCSASVTRTGGGGGGKSTGVLVLPPTDPEMGLYLAGNAAQLSDKVTLYTHGNQEFATRLTPHVESATANFKVDSRQIKCFVDNGTSLTIEFADGSAKQETFLVHNPKTGVNGAFVEQLGLDVSPAGDVQAAAPYFQTSVRGVFAAGDIVSPYKATNAAISSGCGATVAAIAQLQAEKYGIPETL